jgi:hypothetical protein
MPRIARGLFRLWLVLSIAWIVGVGGVTWSWKPPFDPSQPFEVVSSSKRVLSDAEFQALGAPESPKFNPQEFAAFKLSAQRWETIQTAAEVALIPPTLLLILGSALGWAIRGFRN